MVFMMFFSKSFMLHLGTRFLASAHYSVQFHTPVFVGLIDDKLLRAAFDYFDLLNRNRVAPRNQEYAAYFLLEKKEDVFSYFEKENAMNENWGLCKECKWWQIEPDAAVADMTTGLCIDDDLQPFQPARFGKQRLQSFHGRRAGPRRGLKRSSSHGRAGALTFGTSAPKQEHNDYAIGRPTTCSLPSDGKFAQTIFSRPQATNPGRAACHLWGCMP